MTFKICDASTGGNCPFSENHDNVNVSTGIFNVLIGETEGLPMGYFDGNDRFIETVVGGTTLPRQKITSVGYAVYAATAATLSQNASIKISVINASSGTFTAAGPNQYSLSLSSGIYAPQGTITAGLFVGDGSGLTNLASNDATKVLKAGDTMTGQLTLRDSTFTVLGADATGQSAKFAYGVSAGSITASSGIFTATGTTQYSLTTSSGIQVGGTGGVSAAFLNGTHYGDGSNLTGVLGAAGGTMTGQLTLKNSTLTVLGADATGQSAKFAYGVSAGSITASSATFTATGSNQYSLTTSSGVNVGGLLKVSAAGIQWADGKVSTTAATASTGGGAVLTSSAAHHTIYFHTGNSAWTAVDGTTLTIMANGHYVCAEYICPFGVTYLGNTGYAGFLYNGQYIDGMTSKIGFTNVNVENAYEIAAAPWKHCSESTYTGSVSVVAVIKVKNGALGHVYVGYNNDSADRESACQMRVWEAF